MVTEELRAAAGNLAAQLHWEPLSACPWDEIGADEIDSLTSMSVFDKVSRADRDELMRLAIREPAVERGMGAMVGMAVADSVGHPLEFLPVCEPGHWFDPKTLEWTGEMNRFQLKPGQWTDDSSQGLCIADSLLRCRDYNGTDIRVRIWNWWKRGYNNAFRLDPSRRRRSSVGLGGNIGASIDAIGDTYPPPRYNSGSEDAGNGSLMRLAPIPLYFSAEEELAIRASAESSYSTHPGSVAADACGFLGFVIVRAVGRGTAACEPTAAEFLDACAAEYLARPGTDEAKPTLARLLRGQEPAGSKELCWNWRDPSGPFLEETLAARGHSYNGYPVSAGYFGSYCMDGLAIALHSVYHTTSFLDALARCVNFLGDADSTGAICGQIAGAFYGFSAIDARLVARLERWDGGEFALRGALLMALGAGRLPAANSGGHALMPLPPGEDPREGGAQEAERLSARGGGCLERGELEEALRLYSRAIELHPNDLAYHSGKCSAWIAMGEACYEEVLQTCHEVLARRHEINELHRGGASFDKVAAVLNCRAGVYQRQGKWDSALEAYSESLTAHNTDETRRLLKELERARAKSARVNRSECCGI